METSVRACCQAGSHLTVIEDRPEITVRRCDAPQADGSVCGRRHFTARLIGLDARPIAAPLGESL